MRDLKRALEVVMLLQALACVPALAQEYQGYSGVFEGFSGPQAVILTDTQETYWLVDQNTRFSNGRPFPGDRVHVEVDTNNRAVYFAVKEHPVRRTATVDHLEGPVIVVRTEQGVEMWSEVPTTWHIDVAPRGLQSGDSIDVGVFHNGSLAYLRLDTQSSATPPPAAVDQPTDSGDAMEAQVAPPPLPYYDVPPCPEPDYIWTPGHWRWGPSGYYWVPGVWVAPPASGLLWTPGYWAFDGEIYLFHAGYWGAHVGYYGGIVYGGGYYGEGFVGERWERGHVVYNTAAVPVNTTIIHNTYVSNTVVINNQTTTINNVVNNSRNTQNVSFNGSGGARAVPTASEQQWANEAHIKPTTAQLEHIKVASANPQLKYSFNHGRPRVLAAPRPLIAQHPMGPSHKGPGSSADTITPSGHPQNQQQGRPRLGIPTMGPEANNPHNTQSPPQTEFRPLPEPHLQAHARYPAEKKKAEKEENDEKREERER